jgi:hypothetical protein
MGSLASIAMVAALATVPLAADPTPASAPDSSAAPAMSADSSAAHPAEVRDSAAPAQSASAASDSVAPPIRDYEPFFDRLLAQRADSTHVTHVSRVTIRRDAGVFTLEDGDLRLATPVEGRVCAMVFTGKGSFAMTPRTRIEREQLQRFYGATAFERPFTTLVLLFNDSTLVELSRGRDFAPAPGSKIANVTLRECLRYVGDEKSKWLDAGAARPLLEGRGSDYFFALIDAGVGVERLFFELDPHRTESVAFYQEPRFRHVCLKRVYRRNEVCRFARAGADTLPDADVRPALHVDAYRVESRIAENLDFSATATMECEASDDPVRWARFTLYEGLDVDSVSWGDGRPARYFKGKDSPQLWVSCDPPISPGGKVGLRMRYHGRLIERIGDWMLVEAPTDWYPQTEGWERAPMDLVFHAPSQYLLASIGERQSSETRGHVTTSRWVSGRPVRNATFVIGVFNERMIGPIGAPPATALVMTGLNDSVSFVSIGEHRFKMGGTMEKGVADDAGRALAFFQNNLGPPSAPLIRVVELPALGGEAFPGLVRLSWTPFSGPNAAAEDGVFRAHEIAHQWWGVDVDFKTYHDQWLSEGFAQYSALWYVQAGRKDNHSYFAVLDQWQDEILADRRQRPQGVPLGPVWLGGRTATVEAPSDFQLIVYKKGAWVLHMLRNLMLDLKTMDDERFVSLMRDFYARYAGKAASTDDFRRIAQRYAGEDLGWFFDQWVYGSDSPTYRFASKTERTSDGKYKVSCRVEQRGVPDDFRMPVPIRIDFADGRFTWVRALIQGPKTEFDLPLMELAPKQVVFNDLQSVLCRVEPVKW